MPSPPPAPRRTRSVRPEDWPSRAYEPPTQRVQGQAVAVGRVSVSDFDSSDDILLGGAEGGAGPSRHHAPAGITGRAGPGSNSSFTFADSRPAGITSSATAGPSRLFANDVDLISKLTGRYTRGRSANVPSSDFSRDATPLEPSTGLVGLDFTPPIGGPSKARTSNNPFLQQRASEDPSSFPASPRPNRGNARQPHPIPSTPLGGKGYHGIGLNADGSFSVIRDEDEANNSGLLELGPLSSFGRHADLFGLRKFRNLQLKSREGSLESQVANGAVTGRSRGSAALGKSSSSEAANGSIVEHSMLSEVPESDEADGDVAGTEDADHNQHLLQRLRLWRQDAMEHHLYDTAIFWGEKVLCMEAQESQRPNDAYFLAKAYFLTHQYTRAEHLLVNPLLPAVALQPAKPILASQSTHLRDCTAKDALEAALEGSRKNSVLPETLTQRSAGKSAFHAGVLQPADEQAEMSEDEIDRAEGKSVVPAPERKRKDRDFTVSGTGTGSDSTGGEVDSDGATEGRGHDGSSRKRDTEVFTPPTNTVPDFRKGVERPRPLRPSSPGLSMPSVVYDAWRGEQDEALRLVQSQSQTSSLHGRPGLNDKTDQLQISSSQQPLVNISSACRYLAAKCRICLGRFSEALDLIGEESGRWIRGGANGRYGAKAPSSDGLLKVASSVTHLRGLIHLRLDNLDAAREAFIEALRIDVKNYDAFVALVDGKLLSGGQVYNLIEGLEWEAQSNGDKQSFDFIRFCYMTKLDKEDQANAVRAASARKALWAAYGGERQQDGLCNSTDLLYALAEDLYARRRCADALIVTRRILSLDSEHEQTIDLHISCIASLPQDQAKVYRPQLFLLANRLVEEHPDRASSWFAAGTWYSTSQRWAEARKYFSKATLLNPRHLPCWLSFAHSFSLEGESEQAVLAYSSVVKTFPNVHYAKACLGSEHLRMGNLKLARMFLEGARDSLGGVEHENGGEEEMGVLCYYEGRYAEAITILKRCLHASSAAGEPSSAHLTTRINLAWALIKGDRPDEARKMFQSVIEVDSTCVVAYLGLAMADHRLGRLADAVGWYHDALALDPRQPQATELLQVAMEEYASLPIDSEGLAFPSRIRNGKNRGPFKYLDLPPAFDPTIDPPDGQQVDANGNAVTGYTAESASVSSVMDFEGDEEHEVSEETRPISTGSGKATFSARQGAAGQEESADMDETG